MSTETTEQIKDRILFEIAVIIGPDEICQYIEAAAGRANVQAAGGMPDLNEAIGCIAELNVGRYAGALEGLE